VAWREVITGVEVCLGMGSETHMQGVCVPHLLVPARTEWSDAGGRGWQSLLWRKAQEELGKAKQYTAEKNKRAALQCLKKKKMYETQADQVRRGGGGVRDRESGCGSARVCERATA
jgi:hypothetical protein